MAVALLGVVVGTLALLIPSLFAGWADREGLLLVALLFTLAWDGLDRPRAWAWVGVAAASAGLFSLVMTTELAASTVTIVIFVVAASLHRRPYLAVAAPSVFGLTLVVAWFGSGQSLRGIAPFLSSAYQIVSMYPAAMSLPAPVGWLVVGTGIVLVAVASAVIATRRHTLSMAVLVCALPALFVNFRDGFVRYAPNRVPIFLSITLVFAVVLAAAMTGSQAQDTSKGTATQPVASWPRTAAALGMITLVTALTVAAQPSAPFAPVVANLRGLVHMGRLLVDPAARRALTTSTKRFFAAQVPLPPQDIALLRTGTVEPTPLDIGAIYAYDLRWSPQPVLQSFAAFSSGLDKLDADHLLGPGRPDLVLLSTEAIDNRYSLFDQPDVFRALLDGFMPATLPWGNQLILRPRTTAPTLHATELGTTCAPFGATVAVPDLPGRWVFADVDVAQSTLGNLSSAVFSAAPLEISLHLATGADVAHRMTVGTARDGLFVSAYAPDAPSEYGILTGAAPLVVNSFTLSSPIPADYSSTVCVRLWSQTAATTPDPAGR